MGVPCDMAQPISRSGQPTPELGERSSLCSSEVTGAAEGLKTPGAAFRVPEDMVTPNLLHQDAGARMGGELPPYTPSIQASPSSLVQLGGSKHGEVSDA